MQEISVRFDASTYSLDALNAAAYRLIGTASFQVEADGGSFVCHLTPVNPSADVEAIRLRFIDTVTDECLRERIAAQTEPVRNLILSLAFGALAANRNT